jgi:hypothetical protein
MWLFKYCSTSQITEFGINFNSVNYSVQSDQNRSYFLHNYSVDISYTFGENFIFSSLLNYTGFTGNYSDFNRDYLIWNARLTKQIFKNKRGELTLSIQDLLNQNRNVSRNVYDNTIEDVQNNVLKRFALLTFTYNINRAGNTASLRR